MPFSKPSKTKPLSAYNLFFQYNRIKLLESSEGKPVVAPPPSDDENAPPPGLEDVISNPSSPFYDLVTTQGITADTPELRRYRMDIIEHALDNSPFNPKDKKSKKAAQGSMTFLEMSNYMSKKWNDADETTKAMFRQLSGERKAKMQKLEFDSYKMSAMRFATVNTSSSTSSASSSAGGVGGVGLLGSSASMPILNKRVVSLDTVGSCGRLPMASHHPHQGIGQMTSSSSSSGMGNASWDLQPVASNTNVKPNHNNIMNGMMNAMILNNNPMNKNPNSFMNNAKVASNGFKTISPVNSSSNIHSVYQPDMMTMMMNKTPSFSGGVNNVKSTYKPIRKAASATNVLSSSYGLHRRSGSSNMNSAFGLTRPAPKSSNNVNDIVNNNSIGNTMDLNNLNNVNNKRDSLDMSNFDWEKPLVPLYNKSTEAEELLFCDRPLPFVTKEGVRGGNNNNMSTDELRSWLSDLDWNRV